MHDEMLASSAEQLKTTDNQFHSNKKVITFFQVKTISNTQFHTQNADDCGSSLANENVPAKHLIVSNLKQFCG